MRLQLLTITLFIGFALTSCQKDECIESVCIERIISSESSVENTSRVSVTIIDLSGMSSDLEIKAKGNLEHYQTTGDLNLNGYTLRLVNIKLTVVGNMNGNGTGGGSTVSSLGTSKVCVQGSIQNNPYYNKNDFTCESLSSGGVSSVYDGSIEVECGELLIGEMFREGNNWYKVIECY
jgi:hypothetical protein